ncbi:MBL fold metallo-hydrolase [Nonomuraea jiangxiensis]|uniref:Glyoxylase, beta-lactamase superfamily II n=1 Tax=Nonomuraea jiangxiensis TaxID=633440 RepID=A0A1G8D4G1_9ACTN|nr:MBL fold metallo-hydrolase [Nonomuraea jiangxiensis]SDH52678.1 Glyoxylase, beta-lactamase superfamily II [Nonomuraea jiangxiensis]
MEVTEVIPGIYRVLDTCHVYVVVAPAREGQERTGIAIDFGSGRVLDLLGELGIDRLTDVLMTHHHRDQAQGLARAVEAGIAVHVPPVERDLFDRADEMWAGRGLLNDYDLRDDRFSLLESVPVTGVVPEYRTADYGGVSVRVLPTPGHTPGSVTYVVDRVAFTGDLIYAPGKVWSLAATQWSYTENEGPAMTILSCELLRREEIEVLLPSHGEPMTDPAGALARLSASMQRYVDFRRPHPWDLRGLLANPFVQVTPHLLMNKSSQALSYVLLSESGAAMVFDFGYDMSTGLVKSTAREARRPWLASMPALREHYGVTRVEVAVPTHYHDDHVAGMPLLRDVEGAELWVPSHIAPVLAVPLHHDLPCQWYDPIPADRELALGETVRWREYAITVHDLPGHTLFAAAYEFEVDGHRVLVTGDQQDGMGTAGLTGPARQEMLNFQYKNGFRIDDYRKSAALYRRIRPDLMVSGHWRPRWVDDDYLRMLTERGEELVALHHDLLPLDELDLGADGVLCRLTPYHSRVPAGGEVVLTATVRNPFPGKAEAVLRPVVPPGWRVEPRSSTLKLPGGGSEQVRLRLGADRVPRRRVRLAVDVTIGDLRLGQHAEALVDVVGEGTR